MTPEQRRRRHWIKLARVRHARESEQHILASFDLISTVFACHDAACAPPPAGRGGSLPGPSGPRHPGPDVRLLGTPHSLPVEGDPTRRHVFMEDGTYKGMSSNEQANRYVTRRKAQIKATATKRRQKAAGLQASALSVAVFACRSKACAPPPVGTGGSKPGTITRRVKLAGRNLSAPDSGFTLSSKLVPVRTGYAVALKGSDKLIHASDAYLPDGSINPKLVKLVKSRIAAATKVDLPKGTKVGIGGWHNPEDGKLEVNVTVVFPKHAESRALAFGRSQDQIAIARLHDPFEIINTGGTGGDRTVG